MEKRRLLPAFVMLLAGAVAIIMLAIGGYDLKTLLLILLAVLVCFYILGCILEFLLDHFDRQNVKEVSEEGEVIEKQLEENETEEE